MDKNNCRWALYKSHTINNGKVIIEFENVGKGLAIKKGKSLLGFAIAGKDKKFVWAEAEISKGTLIISSKYVKDPRSVRYAWANNPTPYNLMNKDGFNASPFRTDDWDLLIK